jgi:transposase
MMNQKVRRFNMTSDEITRTTVIKRVIAKELTGSVAAELLNLSTRQIKRLVLKYRNEGEAGIISKNIGGHRAFAEDFKQQIIARVSERYADFKPTFAAEKLKEEDGLYINKETLRQLMIEAGLWKGKRRRDVKVHQRRARRSRMGEMVQIDGSHHDWFEGRSPKCCLLVFIDDATSKLMHLSFEEGETTLGYFASLKAYIKDHGIPLSLYSDRHSIFVDNKPDKIDGKRYGTQFERAAKELKITLILANSPQAKGRVERANGILQDRLIKEMRLRGINNTADANAYMPEFIKSYNAKFGIEAASPLNAHKALTEYQSLNLDKILSHQEVRSLSKNLEFSYNNDIYQIKTRGIGYALRYAKVTISHRTNGDIMVTKDDREFEYSVVGRRTGAAPIMDRKAVDILLDKTILEANAAA